MLGVSLRRSLEPDAQASSTQVPRIVQGWLGFFLYWFVTKLLPARRL